MAKVFWLDSKVGGFNDVAKEINKFHFYNADGDVEYKMLIVDLSNRNFILVSGENLNEYGVKGYIDAMRGYNNNFAREVYSFDKALKIEGEYEEGIREFFENNPDRRQDIGMIIRLEKMLFTLLRSERGYYEDVGVLAFYAAEEFTDIWVEKEYVESEYHKEMMAAWMESFYGKN